MGCGGIVLLTLAGVVGDDDSFDDDDDNDDDDRDDYDAVIIIPFHRLALATAPPERRPSIDRSRVLVSRAIDDRCR